MAWELTTRYEIEVQTSAHDSLGLMAMHALGSLALATKALIEHSSAGCTADFVFPADEYSPSLPATAGIISEFHAEQIEPGLWYAAAYLPTVNSSGRQKSMNYASYSLGAYPEKPQVADIGRYFWVSTKPSRNNRQVPKKNLTPVAVINALIPAIEALHEHYAGMREYWDVK